MFNSSEHQMIHHDHEEGLEHTVLDATDPLSRLAFGKSEEEVIASRAKQFLSSVELASSRSLP